jgi:NTE family protein
MAEFDMVFEGGGAKGSAFAGALQVFLERGHKPRRLIGTSAGAITATMLAAGFTPKMMLEATNERLDGKPRFASFMDPPKDDDFSTEEKEKSVTMEIFRKVDLPLVPDFDAVDRAILNALLKSPHYRQLFSFVECGGFFAGNKFLEWVREKLKGVGINPTCTMKSFFEDKGVDLSLVASDTSDVEMLVLNHRTAPDLPLAWAVRMSMSIPFVWREVVWREEWGLYRGRPKVKERDGVKKGNIIVDGGVLSNFPIRLIANEPAGDDLIMAVMGEETVASTAGNLGLLIDEKIAVPGAVDSPKPPRLTQHLRTVQRVGRLVDTMTGAQDNMTMALHEHEICRLPAKGYGTTEFDMEAGRLDALINAGREAMTRHLDGLPKPLIA